MANVLSIGIDLGCDTLKLSYAYETSTARGASKVVYGKIEKKENVRRVAIPAVAYYNSAAGWIFGSDVEKGEEKPFINVVKIKTLLSLLFPEVKSGRIVTVNGAEIYPNSNYYYKDNFFPKFFFPDKQRNLSNFAGLIEDGRAFKSELTPQQVCRKFFEYVRGIVAGKKAEIEKSAKRTFDELRISVVHPSQTGKLYVEELTNLVKAAFGKAPFKVMNNGRALSMFAKERDAVKNDEEILIFDMGEDTLSVLKCFINDDGKVVVEPAADHSMPINIGGNDVDFSIADYIEKSISRRETVGSPSFGEDGHIFEEGLQTKQYLFLKEIKKAKLLLSIPALSEVFKNGVPVSLHRDLYIQLSLTEKQLKDSIGVTDNSGIARKILNYIITELKLPINSEVKKVFLTGGLIETRGLLRYIKDRIKAYRPELSIRTFDDDIENDNALQIQTYEDSVYAPSVGAAIVALKNYEVSAGVAYSYGTWMSYKGNRILQVLVWRGHIIDESKSEKLCAQCGLDGSVPEEIFSVRLSKSTVKNRKYEGELQYVSDNLGETYLCIGSPDSEMRKRVTERFQLKNISGANARLVCSYRGRKITKCEPKVQMREGVMTRPYSTVLEPFVENAGDGKTEIRVMYEDGGTGKVTDTKIDMRFENVKPIPKETN